MPDPNSTPTHKSVQNKVANYLFNPDNQKGWAKGQWFVKALGFDPDKSKHELMLAQQIKFDASSAVFDEMSAWGPRFKQILELTGPNGKIIKGVRAVWQIDTNSEIITLLALLPPRS